MLARQAFLHVHMRHTAAGGRRTGLERTKNECRKKLARIEGALRRTAGQLDHKIQHAAGMESTDSQQPLTKKDCRQTVRCGRAQAPSHFSSWLLGVCVSKRGKKAKHSWGGCITPSKAASFNAGRREQAQGLNPLTAGSAAAPWGASPRPRCCHGALRWPHTRRRRSGTRLGRRG